MTTTDDKARKRLTTKVKGERSSKDVEKINIPIGSDHTPQTIVKWWLADPDTMFHHINGVVKSIQNQQANRKDCNARWLRLYSNFDLIGYMGGVYNRMMPVGTFANRSTKFTFNVIESCIDAVTAKIAKSRPAPKIETNDGTYKQQRKARLLNQYLSTKFDKLKVYDQGVRAFTDSCIFGTGLVKIYIEDNKIKLDRVFVNDISVDEQDAMSPGGPRQMHQDTHVDRDVLMSLFPEKAHLIADAGTLFAGQSISMINQNLVAVRESWHLPSSDESDDGMHAICLTNCVLEHEEWTHDWFPFAVYRWKEFIGWHGTGLAQQLTPIQLEIQRLCLLIAQSIAINCKPTVWVPMEADVIAEQIAEEIGTAVRYSGGREPTFVTPPAQAPEVYAFLENCFNKAYAVSGISQLSAQSQKPAGLNSGAALREFQDIETVRFELQEQRLEEFYCDIAMKILTFSKELYSEKGGKVKIKDRRFIKQIDWKELDMDFDEFEMGMFPVSSLPDTPSGRMQSINEYTQAGYIDRAHAMELLRLPDLDDYVSVQVAAVENAKMVVDAIRWEAEWTQPDPLMDLNTCISLATASWLNSAADDTPVKNRDMLAAFIEACISKLKEINPPPPPPPPPPMPGQVLAAPAPLPVSPLVPQVPKK